MESIQLFIERAMTAKPDFKLTKDNASSVAQICFRLDGIALIDWSYSLLSEQEKTLFRRLAVFVGGWTLEAAESVCGEEGGGFEILDLLTRLVDKSLVITEEVTGETRYRRLETIRQYSREKFFETDEVETIRNRHLAFYVQFAEEAEKQLQGRERVAWIHRLEAEQDNLRSAMEWGLARNPESALRIAASLPIFWTAGGFSAEGFRWIQQATVEYMEEIGEHERLSLRAKGLGGLAYLYMSLGDNINGKRVAEESVALFRQCQDQSGLAYSLVSLSFPLIFLGERLQAESALMESIAIARSEKNVFVLVSALNNLTRLTLNLHSDTDAAERYADEAIHISQEAGIEWATAVAHEMKGLIAARRKDYDEARALIEKAIHAYQETSANFNITLAKSALAHMERDLGNYAIARDIYRETIVAFRDAAQIGAVAHQLECFGFIAFAHNQNERALQLFAAANALREKGGTPMTPDEQIYYDEQLIALRERMEPTAFESAWSKGNALSMDDAITLAIEEVHD